MSQHSQIVLSQRPKKGIDPSLESGTFKLERVSTPSASDISPDDVLIKVDTVSLDPAMRGWLNDIRSYVPPVKIGEVMRAGGLGTVIAVGKSVKKLKQGDSVYGTLGWQEVAVVPAKELQKIETPKGATRNDWLGALGLTGLTAYFGLLEVGKVKAGETVLVSGAAGAVGSMACQIAKLKGCKVIGIAGTTEKCDFLRSECKVDQVLNYKDADFKAKLRSIPLFDVFFDNVGGEQLNIALQRMRPKARVVLCGAIAGYNGEEGQGLTAYPALIAFKARMEGFIVFEYESRYADAAKEIAGWLAEGKIKRKETKLKGIESCPGGLVGLFEGANTGKMLVEFSSPSSHL
ncbi:uncharacterized protein L969DRAFT_379003 [Mixia osmundae IAM 14324]|uniref:Enoyl reductase (ER) domain-containing protein n=1 Tax=Mixia osmundae (strain CBS 9802 / IAM 14324 / JCM 22182 / KY 12970) TaxID=764103 RepID=G7E950_MIXOS|nr:uncharacterized protein L969DRAFT_379003 [Mixia osmundae IAM 14324]KEI39789.1 hypothetical protein L969DRAFT_379003 [Mixia osmundae IAM 14324]GAA99169.1 hypothetical protein E5Q_05861 [Mixia osmundae IAM 14324]